MRGKFIRNYQRLLVSNCLEEFESSLSYSFLSKFGKLLPLSHSQLDWLVLKLRPFRKQKFSSTALKSHYIRKIDYQTSLDRKNFFTLLQFLVYAQTLDYEIDSLKSTRYRLVRFRVQDFLRYTGETYNYCQLKAVYKVTLTEPTASSRFEITQKPRRTVQSTRKSSIFNRS